MKTHMQKITVAILSIFIAGMMYNTADAQNYTGNRGNCLATITDLTEKQETKIENLRKDHFDEMDELRNERRAAIRWEKKEKIGIQMAEKRLEHLKEIKNVLNEEQREEFEESMNNGRRRGMMYGPGHKKGKGRGYGRGNGRGRGNCPRW